MIEKILYHDEYYNAIHKWDSKPNRHADWENNLFKKSTSAFIRGNNNTLTFMQMLHNITTLMIDMTVIPRNWFNYRVDKYYNDHCN